MIFTQFGERPIIGVLAMPSPSPAPIRALPSRSGSSDDAVAIVLNLLLVGHVPRRHLSGMQGSTLANRQSLRIWRTRKASATAIFLGQTERDQPLDAPPLVDRIQRLGYASSVIVA